MAEPGRVMGIRFQIPENIERAATVYKNVVLDLNIYQATGATSNGITIKAAARRGLSKGRAEIQ